MVATSGSDPQKAAFDFEGDDVPQHDEEQTHDEEAQDVKMGTVPLKPSAAEVERHRVAHYPYRRWCRECLEGQAVGDGHKASPSQPLFPIVGIDYFYITKDSKFVMKDETEEAGLEGAVKCLIIRDRMTKCIFAMVVPQKGVDEERWIVRQVVDAIEWLGHAKILIKSDQERSRVSLVRQAMKDLKVKEIAASDEESAKYESQSNGATEAGVRIVRGSFRTLRLDLERRLGWQIPIEHPVMHWLLLHVSNMHNALKVGDDGYTPWIRARGRPFNMPLCCFGEQVGYKYPGKGPLANPRGNMGPMWGAGTWLGVKLHSNEHVIANQDGIHFAAKFARRPTDEAWKTQPVAELQSTPHSLREARRPGAVFEQPTERHPPLEEKGPPLPRSFKITKRDLTAHGFTEDCPQCDHIRAYGEPRPGQTHTPTCRARVMHEVGKTAVGQARLAKAEGTS